MNVIWINAAGLVANEKHDAHATSELSNESAAEQAAAVDAAARLARSRVF